MYTYSKSFHLKPMKNITSNDIITCCKTLTNVFNEYFKTTKYHFVPTGSGGGIQMIRFPGYQKGMYKSIRIHFQQWPWDRRKFHNNTKPIILIKQEYQNLSTFLIAICGAPVWTLQELKLICLCFKSVGMNVIKSSFSPKQKKLIKMGDLGESIPQTCYQNKFYYK